MLVHSSNGAGTSGGRMVRMKETPDQILLKAEYALDINDSYVGDCVIDIEVRPREGGKLNL
jgi:hypothetical protein